MSYYDALKVKWATLSGSTADKLAAVNAATVAGPAQDVTVEAVAGQLLLNGVYPTLAAFAAGAASGNATHDAALQSAKVLMAWVTVPNAPSIKMSDPTVYATVAGMAAAIVAQETASPGSAGFTATFSAKLLGLAATTLPWATAPVSIGGGGLGGPVSQNDLDAAGGLV